MDAILQARMSATRLPGKVLMPVLGRPTLSYNIARIRLAKTIDRVVVATTENREDDAVQRLCESEGVPVFRGREEDVLDRIYRCMKQFGMAHCAKFTADNPLIDPAVIDQVVGFYLAHPNEYDYVSNNHPPTWQDGQEVEVFSAAALETAWREATQPFQREHGTGRSVCIIAEAGVNHNGNLKRALELVDAAAEAGADAVKFQTFSADLLVTHLSPKAKYQCETTDPTESQYEMLKKLELSLDAHRELKRRAEKHGIVFLSTPFDKESADLLEKLDVPAFKIGSGELTDLPLPEHVARKGQPMILSTGMSWPTEVNQAVRTVQKAGQDQIALLHCVSAYPAPAQDVNLRVMEILRNDFNVPVGYSDHTEGIEVAVLAVACEANIIEKHLTLDRKLPGPD